MVYVLLSVQNTVQPLNFGTQVILGNFKVRCICHHVSLNSFDDFLSHLMVTPAVEYPQKIAALELAWACEKSMLCYKTF